MLDKLLKMDSVLLTIKAQIAKYTALFEADGEIDATERAFLNALEEDAKRVDEKLGKVIEKAKAAATEKPVTIEKTEALAVEEVAVTEKAAGGMEELEAVPVMSGEEKGATSSLDSEDLMQMEKEESDYYYDKLCKIAKELLTITDLSQVRFFGFLKKYFM